MRKRLQLRLNVQHHNLTMIRLNGLVELGIHEIAHLFVKLNLELVPVISVFFLFNSLLLHFKLQLFNLGHAHHSVVEVLA